MADRAGRQATRSLAKELPTARLAEEGRNLLRALALRAVTDVSKKVGDTTDRLTDYAEHGGPGLKAVASGAQALADGKSPAGAAMGGAVTGIKEKVKQAFGAKGDGGGAGKGLKVTNIVEHIDVGVPRRVAYNQWTQFQDFPSFMKKVESVEQTSEEKLSWRAQVFFSHRNWESTIKEQVPDERVVWRSSGAKGYVDGTVTFHELAPDLTRILFILEYHPQGFFEGTANLWRAQGRRTRLEIKHFRRHVMTKTILNPDEIEGWRGEIRDGEVVKTHEDALKEEAEEERVEKEEADDEYAEYEDEDAEEAGEGGAEEAEGEAEEAEAEYEDEREDEYEEEPEAEEEPEEEPEPRGRSRTTTRQRRGR